MIIRNPYGFIAKHYKIINLLLLVPLLYIAFKFGDIGGFFRDFVKANYSTPETDYAVKYVTTLTFIVLFLMILIHAALYFVCLSKRKRVLYFLVSTAYYVLLLFLALFFRVTMENMQLHALDQTFANFVRDCANLSPLPSYFLFAVGLAKGAGFNVRTLRFDNNAELVINENDDENIELRIGSEDNNFKKNAIHLLRELKYYILENKFVFTCFAVVASIAIVTSIVWNFQVYNKTYSINQELTLENFTISLKDSYLTDTDYSGRVIADGKYFLAIKLGIINNGRAASINSSNFRIYLDNESLYPSYDRASRFIDVGKIYQGEIIPNVKDYPGGEYVLVYELTKDQIKNSYQMRILNGLSAKGNKLIKRYKKINIKPTKLLKTEKNKDNIKLGSEVSFKTSMIGDTTYKLKSLKTVTYYNYDEVNCVDKKCNNVTGTIVPSAGNALVVIEDEIKWDETTDYYKNGSKDFYTDFATLSYTFKPTSGVELGNDKYNVTTMKNVTPSGLKKVKIYEVSSTVLKSVKIDMLVKIRNRIYTIEVK